MPGIRTNTYRSQIQLTKRYRDRATGFEGVATCLAFFEHGCERVTLKGMDNQGRIVEYAFDAPEVDLVDPKKSPRPVTSVSAKPGGPKGSAPMPGRR